MRNYGEVSEERRTGQRRYAPKTRTGCVTCKIRRVKCDEAKPSCNRCTSTGRKCDGYSTETPSRIECRSSAESLRPSLVIDVSCDPLERRTFDFFRSNTAPCVAGYFQDHLWDRLILQVSHSEPAVRHAINALGAQHEENVLRRKANSGGQLKAPECRTSFPVMQYSKALFGLQKLLSSENVSMNLVLMCSLAFIHFESLRESFIPALVHMENAIRLLHSSTNLNAKTIDPALVRAMVRIDVQGTMYLGMRVPGLSFYTAATDSSLPVTFQDLTQARDLVNTWSGRMYHFMRTDADDYKFREPGGIPLELITKAQELERTFLDLNTLLWDFLHKPNVRLTARESDGLNMLRCRVKIDRILSACCLYSEATMYDIYLDQFKEILSICQYVIASEDADRRLFSVSLDEGLPFPLWFVSTHCRDSRIRHEAIILLRRLVVGRSVWHMEAMTRTAQLCIELEERGCVTESPKCADIPEWRRVHSAGLDGTEVSSAPKKVKVYFRSRPNGMDGEWTLTENMIECGDCTFSGNFDELYETSATSLPMRIQRTDAASPYGVEKLNTEPWMASVPFRLWLQHTGAHGVS